jgi:hypothetical protein
MLGYSDLERRNDGYRAMCGFGTTKSPGFPKELEKKTGFTQQGLKSKPTFHR